MALSKIFLGFFIPALIGTVSEPLPLNKLNKQLIGSKRINFSVDHDVIFNINGQFPFKSIILEATLGQIQMKYLKIYYTSGNVKDVQYDRVLKPGTINVSTALTESALYKIEFGYVKDAVHSKTNPHPHKRAKLTIWGYYN